MASVRCAISMLENVEAYLIWHANKLAEMDKCPMDSSQLVRHVMNANNREWWYKLLSELKTTGVSLPQTFTERNKMAVGIKDAPLAYAPKKRLKPTEVYLKLMDIEGPERIVPVPLKTSEPWLTCSFAKFPPEVREWIQRQIKISQEISMASEALKVALCSYDRCFNTWGQARRVWPELITFLPEKVQGKLGDTIARQPGPGEERLIKNYKDTGWISITNRLLAQAMMVIPESDKPAFHHVRYSWRDRPSVLLELR